MNFTDFQAMTGINLKEDLARPLGGEFAVAVDGPVLPVPSWKLALEVTDPQRFEQTLEKLVERANAEAAGKADAPQFHIDHEESGGRTWYVLRAPKLSLEAHYVFESGFLIAAPSRDLLLRAMEYRATGNTLASSAKFKALLPHDGHTNFSAMVYHSLGTALAPLADNIVVTPEQRASLAAAASAGPALVLAYGEQDRIEFASAGTFFGMQLEKWLGIHAGRGARTGPTVKRGYAISSLL
jgi:hypothetical protein